MGHLALWTNQLDRPRQRMRNCNSAHPASQDLPIELWTLFAHESHNQDCVAFNRISPNECDRFNIKLANIQNPIDSIRWNGFVALQSPHLSFTLNLIVQLCIISTILSIYS
jgi:hypothetical protein